MGTSGSEGGQQKPTSRKTGRALLSDPYTEHPTGEGKLYLCAVKDVFSGRIVGYSIADRMKARLAVDALACVARRGDDGAAVAGCVVHSDRGCQFRSQKSSWPNSAATTCADPWEGSARPVDCEDVGCRQAA